VSDVLRELARQRRQRFDPAPDLERGDPPTKPGRWTADRLGLPVEDPCPVVPLGIEGKTYHLIDSAGQYVTVTAKDLTHAGIQALFGAAPNWPKWAFPRRGRSIEKDPDGNPLPGPVKSFEDDAVRDALFLACSRAGLFSTHDRLRGRGAWEHPAHSGKLIYHAGEELYVCEGGRIRTLECGLHDGILYPRFPAIPAPAETIRPDDFPATRLIQDFQTFTWERPAVDPYLLLGWLGVAILGGALRWRSALFLIGDRETGKSTLHEFIKAILGDAVVSTAETTKPGIYQLMRHDARAVAIDELEASATDGHKAIQVIELARVASSGGLGLRGSADQTPTEFRVCCAFLFSAINPPAMQPQDLSRVARIRLLPRDKARSGERPPDFPTDTYPVGRLLLTRLMTEWRRWPETFEAYRTALRAGGHSGRGQDTYGTLLAMADLMLGPELGSGFGITMADDLSFWTEALAPEAISEVADTYPNWMNCVLHILQARVPAWRSGFRATVGQLLAELDRPVTESGDCLDLRGAIGQLGQAGLGLIEKGDKRFGFKGWGLIVPNQSPLLMELFEDTVWAGMAGAAGWPEALRAGAPSGAIIKDKTKNKLSVNGVQCRCTVIDVELFKELMQAL
jgi:hypothetical protein